MMGSLSVVEGEEHVKMENEESKASSSVYAHHRRSRSASEQNADNSSRLGVHHSREYNHKELPTPTRAYGLQTPPHGCSSDFHARSSTNHRASLEKDIHQLQLHLQQEKLMRMMLEKAIGRASSTLSPGHRHFASQTKELIAEIELLEEEVANREKHVLSLYRNIFEHCISRPPSEQGSGVSSPAHLKSQARKHPSIISSAFCSSTKFSLRPLQALSSKSKSVRKDSKTGHASLSGRKDEIHFERTCSNPVKVQDKSSAREKSAGLRTLKDHLHQCPSKLSEEMVRSMAAVYCWLCNSESAKSEKRQSSVMFKSSDNIVLPHRTSKSLIEISSMPTDKNRCSGASYAINNYRVLVEQLERVNVSQMESKAQIAFWINIYNSLIMHAYLAYGIPQNSLRRLALFHKAAYNIGGYIISAYAIEHAIFCFHTPRIGGWLETILSTAMRKKTGEERQLIGSKFSLPNLQSLVSFALCSGAFSDPVMKVYTASNVKTELERAKREFLQAAIAVKKSKKILLPKLLERVARESSFGSDDLLKWVGQNVDQKLYESIQKCIGTNAGSRKASQSIGWLPYSSKFRYVFSKELASKPWWL